MLKTLARASFSSVAPASPAQEEVSKHRMKLPLYDLEPRTEQNWIAPNATVIGEVQMRRFASVWYNAVIRGDINRVEINQFASIGENSVLHTAPSLPTGMNAKLHIGRNTVVGNDCTLYSCHIGDDVVIGDKCVILEGARIENGAQIAAGSVVPPGRLIPTKQLWGGNPCCFIKDLNIAETWSNYTKSYIHHFLSDAHKNEFSPWNNAYLYRDSTHEDLEIDLDNFINARVSPNMMRGVVKYYA